MSTFKKTCVPASSCTCCLHAHECGTREEPSSLPAHLALEAGRYVMPPHAVHWSLPGSVSTLLVGYAPARQGEQADMPAAGWGGQGAGSRPAWGARLRALPCLRWATRCGEPRGGAWHAPLRGAYLLEPRHGLHSWDLPAGTRAPPDQYDTSPLLHSSISDRAKMPLPPFSLYPGPVVGGEACGSQALVHAQQWGAAARSAAHDALPAGARLQAALTRGDGATDIVV